MKVITEKKRVTLTFRKLILDDGYEFSDVYELLNILEEAYDTDGYFTRLVLYNNWGKKLEELGVLSGSNRGSYSCGKKHKKFWNEVYELVYGEKRDE